MLFYDFIIKHHSQDMSGHFADTVRADKYFPKDALTQENILQYLYHKNASDRAIMSFKRAWKLYIKGLAK